MTASVAIVGGGLAGMSCAKELADAGLEVSLFEHLPYFGGRASTFRDVDGRWIEQGLHLFLGTYTEFKRLLSDIGAGPQQTLFWMDEIKLRNSSGARARFGINPLHAPVKTVLRGLIDNSYLGPIDKLSAVPFAGQGLLSMKTLEEKYDGMTVAELWRKSGASNDVLERFARPFCRAIQFTDAEEFSAYDFLGWIHHALYDLPHARLGGYQGARDVTMFQPLARYLRGKGAKLQCNAGLRELLFDPASRRIIGLRFDNGEIIRADEYVLALPAWKLAEVPSTCAQ